MLKGKKLKEKQLFHKVLDKALFLCYIFYESEG